VDSFRKTSRDSYFNSVKFWQEAYEKSEEAQSRLLDKIYDLEQRNDVLFSKMKAVNHGNENRTGRNAVVETPQSEAMSQKRMNGYEVDGRKSNNNKRGRQPAKSGASAQLGADTIGPTGSGKRKRDESPCPTEYEDAGK
jgi:hypothetical protein